MQFELTEEQQLLRDMARSFADQELFPRAKEHDRKSEIDPVIFEKFSELGFWGLTVPEQYGGAGMGNQALALVLEEINRGCASTGVTLSVHNSLVCAPIVKWGTDEQKQDWLPRLATGECRGAYCLTEPDAGSDAGAIRTMAVRDGDDLVIDGTKIWVTNGGFADMFVVYCRTDPEASRSSGISALLIPRDTPGVQVQKEEKKTGIRASSTVGVVFEGVRIPAKNVLGELDRGFPIALDTLDGGRIGIAAQAVGIGRACLEAAIKYSGEREQFGRPINRFQAIQWKLADMSTRLGASHHLVMHAAWLRDRGEACTRQAAEAKLFASQTANFCADECLQIHGGAGYTDDFHVERLFRDARITEIYEGATDIQRLVIARALTA